MVTNLFRQWLSSDEATQQLKQFKIDSLREEVEIGIEQGSFQSGGLNNGDEN